MKLVTDLFEFDDHLFRNVPQITTEREELYFDDLSNELEVCIEANHLAEEHKNQFFGQGALYYNAIDYVFQLKQWIPSRFSNGSFPVWYGSLGIETTFHETIFHWCHSFLSDAGFLDKKKPIYMARTVYDVRCQSNLVDFRNKTNSYPFLIQKNIDRYEKTQELGWKLKEDGLSGLITYSTRIDQGTNIALFNKKALSQPKFEGNYLYEYVPGKKAMVNISDERREQKLLSLILGVHTCH